MEFILPLPHYNEASSESRVHWSFMKQRLKSISNLGQDSERKTHLPCSSVLLHIGGADIYELFNSLPLQKKPDPSSINNLLDQIEDRCMSGFILLYERFKFFTCNQVGKDSVGEYIASVQSQARYCEFYDHIEKYVVGRIINGVSDEKLRIKLKGKNSLDLITVFDICGKNSECNSDTISEREEKVVKESKLMLGGHQTRDRDQRLNARLNRISTIKSKLNSNSLLLKKKRSIISSSVSVNAKTSKVKSFHTKNVTEENGSATNKNSLFDNDIFQHQLHNSNPAVTFTYIPEKDIISEICVTVDRDSCERKDFGSSPAKLQFISEENYNHDDQNSCDYEKENDSIMDQDNYDSKSKKIKTCAVCGRAYKSAHKLKCHMLTHTGQRLYKCQVCDLGFLHSGSRSRHMRHAHPELLAFKCPECHMLFELQTALDQHQLSHSKDIKISCEDCGQTFFSTRDHYQHRRSEHRNTRYSCEICGLYFPYPSKLKLHLMSKHNATKPYMCEICGSAFAEQNMLVNHKNIHSGEKNHECTTCGQRFLLKTTLNNHMQTHLDLKPYTCDICGMSFKLSYYLKSHMKVHSENRERPHACSTCGAAFFKPGQLKNHERKHTGEKPYKCEFCNALFSQTSSMKKHIKQIHEGLKLDDRFSCEYCGLSFTHSCKLKLHLMKHTGERPFVCKICNLSYKQNHQLAIHMKTHSGEEPFKCPICGRKFLQKSYLEGHIRKHTGDKPFKCKVCESGFTQKSYLRSHMKIHSQNRERNYKCNVCGKAFTCSSHARSHERIHSGDKPHRCEICSSKFTKRSSLKKHLRRIHGTQNVLNCPDTDTSVLDNTQHVTSQINSTAMSLPVCSANLTQDIQDQPLMHPGIHTACIDNSLVSQKEPDTAQAISSTLPSALGCKLVPSFSLIASQQHLSGSELHSCLHHRLPGIQSSIQHTDPVPELHIYTISSS
ncbi:zinc finger protein 540-like [Physella acuta]|uniref:zinc finger protein 540-like n=1 Tax=Physella acuta TaxID=109671 RepID=UPI0027DBA5F3|nr:zinc finger protein 540-like [Physella acuta]